MEINSEEKSQGWFPYWRCWLKDDSIFSLDAELNNLWVYCLSKAAHKSTHWDFIVKGKGKIYINLDPGQFVCGRNSMAKSLNCSPSTTRKRLKMLEKNNYISIKSDKNYSVITILDWDSYTNLSNKKEQVTNQETSQEHDQETSQERNQESIQLRNTKNKYRSIEDRSIEDIYSFWNNLNLVKHRDIKKFKPSINSALKIYTADEIKQAMQNYKDIINSKDHYWTSSHWTIEEFLTRKGGIDRFITDNKPFDTFKSKFRNNGQAEVAKPNMFTGLDDKDYSEGAF